METINLNKKIYSKNQYKRVIDTDFSQLANVSPPFIPLGPEISIENFFQTYNQIFLQIPKTGETNSHEYLVKTSSEYLDVNPLNDEIQALIEEINLLQQTNLELNQQLIELQSLSPSNMSSIQNQIEQSRNEVLQSQTQIATRGRG